MYPVVHCTTTASTCAMTNERVHEREGSDIHSQPYSHNGFFRLSPHLAVLPNSSAAPPRCDCSCSRRQSVSKCNACNHAMSAGDVLWEQEGTKSSSILGFSLTLALTLNPNICTIHANVRGFRRYLVLGVAVCLKLGFHAFQEVDLLVDFASG